MDADFSGDDYEIHVTDIQGSTYSLLDESLQSQAGYEYGDFGETKTTGSSENEICYTGAVYDDVTGLYYMNARYYDPETGRFISQDTYRGENADSGTWHLYTYCANNPINFTDPSGHIKIKIKEWMVREAIDAAFSLTPAGKTLKSLKAIVESNIVKRATKKLCKIDRNKLDKKIDDDIEKYVRKTGLHNNKKSIKYKALNSLKHNVRSGAAQKTVNKLASIAFSKSVVGFISLVKDDWSAFSSLGSFTVAIISYNKYNKLHAPNNVLYTINV